MALVGMGESLGFELGEQVGEDVSGDPTLVMSDEAIDEMRAQMLTGDWVVEYFDEG